MYARNVSSGLFSATLGLVPQLRLLSPLAPENLSPRVRKVPLAARRSVPEQALWLARR
jgi:hypothetical protein